MARKGKVPKMGIDKTVPCRAVVDNSMSSSDLEKHDGKESSPKLIDSGTGQFPICRASDAQLSRASALNSSPLAEPDQQRFSHPARVPTPPPRAQEAESDFGDFAMSNRTNPFRLSLSKLANPGTGDRRETFRTALPLALKALFVEGQVVGTTVLIREAAPWCEPRHSDPKYALYIAAGIEAGWIRRESVEGDDARNAAMAFDLTASSPSFTPVTFDVVLASYLASGVTETARRSAIAATRSYLNLPKHTQLDGILRAAAAITDQTFHRLPWRCLSDAIARADIDRKTAQNFASALRAVLSHGLERNLFALYLPRTARNR